MLNYSLNYIAGLFVSGRISQQTYLKLILNYIFSKSKDGGEGSGNFGHAGIPGQVGGSQTTNSITVSDDDISKYLADNNITKGILSKDYSLSVSELKQRVEQRSKKGWWGFKNKEEFDKAKDIKSDIDNKLQSPVISDIDKEALQQESDKINRQINRYNLVNDIFNSISKEQNSHQKQSEENQNKENQNKENQSEAKLQESEADKLFNDILKLNPNIITKVDNKALQDVNNIVNDDIFEYYNRERLSFSVDRLYRGSTLMVSFLDDDYKLPQHTMIKYFNNSQLQYRNKLFASIKSYLKEPTENNLLNVFRDSETLKMSCDELDNFSEILNKDSILKLSDPYYTSQPSIRDKLLKYKNSTEPTDIDKDIEKFNNDINKYNFREYTKLIDVLADRANVTENVLNELRIENDKLINSHNFIAFPYQDIKIKSDGNIKPAEELAKKYGIDTTDMEKLYNPNTPIGSLYKASDKNKENNVVDAISYYTDNYRNRPSSKMKEVINTLIENSPTIENDLYRSVGESDGWTKRLLELPEGKVVPGGSTFRSFSTSYDAIGNWSNIILRLKGDKKGIFVAPCSAFYKQSEVISSANYKKVRTIETEDGKKIIELETIPKRKKSTDSIVDITHIIENDIKSKILKNKQEFILEIIDNLLKVNNNINKYISNITYNGYYKNDVFNELKKQLIDIDNKINNLIELKNNEKKLYDSINNRFIPNINLSKRMRGVDNE